MNSFLQLKNISKHFNSEKKVKVLKNLSYNFNKGKMYALIGPSGSGKSTLLMTISGVNKAKTGEIIFEGKNITKYEPHDIVDLGIAQAPEGRRIFSRLTVEENLRLGAHANEKGNFFDVDVKDIYDLFPVLHEMADRRGGDLSGGQQQQLAIARALITRPKVLLLDEPTEGIQPNIIQQIGHVIRILCDQGDMAIVLVEQLFDVAYELGDEFTVMKRGAVSFNRRADGLDRQTLYDAVTV